MADLRIDAELAIDTGTRIGVLNAQMRDGFDNVQKAMSRLDGSWDGSAATAAMNKFQAIKNTFCEARYNVVDNYVAFLHKQVGAGYMKTEEANRDLASWFK